MLGFLKRHGATFSIDCCEDVNVSVRHVRKRLSRRRQALNVLPLSKHSGHGRTCCFAGPVAIDLTRTFLVRSGKVEQGQQKENSK